MNTKQAAIVSFLSRAVKGEAEMPPHILNEFADNCKQALNKQFNENRGEFRLRMSNAGKPLCQLQMQAMGAKEETPTYDFKMRMAMGDVLEALMIALLSVPQVTHYIIDGYIWKSNAKNPLIKSLILNN